jgi:hypothetical protein
MTRRWINIFAIMALIMPLMPMGGSADYSYAGDFEDLDLNRFISVIDGHSEARHCTHCNTKSRQAKSAAGLEKLPVPAPLAVSLRTALPLPYATAIQRAIRWGYTAPRFYCARAVWRILIKAGLVRGSWNSSGADAKDMGRVLKRQGFVRDDSACNRPGVVRIYNGNQSGHQFRNPMVGDRAGHMEILGLDGKYHHFLSSPWSISESMRRRYGYASRRPLQSCWIKP